MVGAAVAMPATAQEGASDAQLMERLARLEAANGAMAAEIAQLKDQQAAAPAGPATPPPAAEAMRDARAEERSRDLVGVNPAYGYAILNHTENVNKRLIQQLDARLDEDLDDTVTLSGRAVVVADAHFSNRANKFGYLMRHPTGSNQRTTKTQEVTIHSAQLAVTVAPHPDITAYMELLYDPEQSFGAGTLTAVSRNQIQMRKAYIMWGNLAKTPFYAAAGKMDVPFGLQDSVSPFTNSTNWHAFAPLAFGGQVGYYDGSLSLRGMAVVGGSQFRGANTPVDGTNVPSKLNNFAVDASYRLAFGEGNSAMLGASYIHGSAYCQPYPVQHFGACTERNAAWATYGQLVFGPFDMLAEYAQTFDVLPGSAVPVAVNPVLAAYEAQKVSALTIGGRYRLPMASDTRLSLEFSNFTAGDDGSPWERQNQWVAGISHKLAQSVGLFGEVIRTEGYVPLNFLSGGNPTAMGPNRDSWSDSDARSHVLMLGVQAAF